MENKEMEKKELSQEELNKVAGGKPGSDEPVKVWTCDECGATFTHFVDYSRHMELKHSMIPLI